MSELLDDNWGQEEEFLEYPNASLGARLGAFLIDTAAFGLFMVLTEVTIGSEFGWFAFLAIVIITMVAKDPKKDSLSVGKRMLQLRVVPIHQTHITWPKIVFRTILKYLFVTSPVIFAIVTFISKSQRKDEQQVFFHDVLTKTKVVKDLNPLEKQLQSF